MTGPTATTGERRAPGLGLRFALAFALLAFVTSLVGSTVGLAVVHRSDERRRATEAAGLDARARQGIDAAGRRLIQTVARAETFLRESEPALLRRILEGGPEASPAAERLATIFGFRSLEWIDEQGTVVSSSPRTERAGVAAEPIDVPAGRVVVRELDLAADAPPVWFVQRESQVGSRRLLWRAATEIDEGFLATVAGPEGATLSRGDRRLPDRDRGASATEETGSRRIVVPGDERGDWQLAIRPRAPLPLTDDLTILAAGVAATTLLGLLAGGWLSRRATRPVRELVRAVDAIAAGQADYTFTRQTENAFESLVSAFSRLHRSLELQQERSRAAERVAAWREAARRVAHEVKNPLAPIRLTVENLMRARLRVPEQFDGMFDEGMVTILEEVDRLRRLVDEFSRYARLPAPRKRPAQLEAIVDETLALWSADPTADVRSGDREVVPLLDLDEDQIGQVLKNLVGNAVESVAGAENGRVVVHLRRDAAWAMVTVEDNGPGFGDADRSRLFEPYFTTKEQGTGLGLAISERIVSEHGGLLEAERRESGGARFVLRLPLEPTVDRS